MGLQGGSTHWVSKMGMGDYYDIVFTKEIVWIKKL